MKPRGLTAEQVLERMGIQPQGASGSVGGRFVSSEAYRALRSAGVFRSSRAIPLEHRSVPLLSRSDLADLVRRRTTTDLTGLSIHPTPLVSSVAAPALVPGLVEVIEVEEESVLLAPEASESTLSAGTAVGTALPEAAVNFGAPVPPTKLDRWGNTLPVAKSTLDVPGMVASLLDRRLMLGFWRGLEGDIIAGDGTGQHFTGILHTSGTNAITARGAGFTAENNFEAIARAVAAVQNAGWYGAGPIVVVASPTTLLRTRDVKDNNGAFVDPSELLADVEAWVPSTFVPDGTAIVGDWFDAAALILQEGLGVDMSTEHSDFFVRALVDMKAETRAHLWVRQPSALAVVTNL